MANRFFSQLAYLVTPKPELLLRLGIGDDKDNPFIPVAVVTPMRDYEEAFEGWKKRWMAKAKEDFMADFAETWERYFPDFVVDLQAAGDFDKWWSFSEIDVLNMDPDWNPS